MSSRLDMRRPLESVASIMDRAMSRSVSESGARTNSWTSLGFVPLSTPLIVFVPLNWIEKPASRTAIGAEIGAEIIATPGCESNVKEIFDKCKELRASGQDLMIFNQFEEFPNYLWHYEVTGHAMEEAFKRLARLGDEFRGITSATGSAGTIASGDYMKQVFPGSKIAASEALQCPTLLENGFGSHRIEGIGDKHVPWIHNVRNTDLVVAIDDNAVVNVARLFNEEDGRAFLVENGVTESLVSNLDLLGFSGISNVLTAIKMAKYYEMGEHDVIFTIATDSMDLYHSRIHEMRTEMGEYSSRHAAADFARWVLQQSTDNMLELRHPDRRRVHNLKYYTWVEQQGKTVEELDAQLSQEWWQKEQVKVLRPYRRRKNL